MTRDESVFFEFCTAWVILFWVFGMAAYVLFKANLINTLLLGTITALTSAVAATQFPNLWQVFLLGSDVGRVTSRDIQLNQQLAVGALAGISTIASKALYDILRVGVHAALAVALHREDLRYTEHEPERAPRTEAVHHAEDSVD